MGDTEHEKPNISMFNHNRIGDIFIALSPVLNGWGLFTILLVSIFIGVYWWQHPHNFFDLVANAVNTVAGFIQIIMWLVIAAFGGFILNKLFLPFFKGVKELVRPRPEVIYANDKFMGYTGRLQIHDHQEDATKNVYNHRIVQEIPNQEPLALPAPLVSPVPTGRQLLLDGTVEKHLQQGLIILGQGEDGILKPLKIKRCFSTLVSGLPSVGKTTTVFWIVCQLTLIGAKFWIVDPHMYFEDEEGNRSLASELSDLSDSFVFPPCEGKPQDVIARMRWMYQQLRKRQQPGYIVKAKDTILGIMDEFNSVADSIDPKTIVVKDEEGKPLNFAQTLALIEREGRKYGLHFILIGHKWARQDIGGDNAVRTNATTYLCHRLNDESQANLLLGSGQGKKVLGLNVGAYWITGPTWNAEQAKIRTPDISAADLPVLRQIKQRRIEVINQANVVDADPVASAMASGITSTWRPDTSYGRDTEQEINLGGRPLDVTKDDLSLSDSLHTKMLMVIEMDEQGDKNMNEIISTVWGVNPDSRQGRAAKEELKQIRAYIATHARKTMRLNERGA